MRSTTYSPATSACPTPYLGSTDTTCGRYSAGSRSWQSVLSSFSQSDLPIGYGSVAMQDCPIHSCSISASCGRASLQASRRPWYQSRRRRQHATSATTPSCPSIRRVLWSMRCSASGRRYNVGRAYSRQKTASAISQRPFFSASARTRTLDPLIKSQLLYQLSYGSRTPTGCAGEYACIPNTGKKFRPRLGSSGFLYVVPAQATVCLLAQGALRIPPPSVRALPPRRSLPGARPWRYRE